MEKLKRCPFCGSEAFVARHIFFGADDTFGVICKNVKCYTAGWQSYGTEKEAIEAWNRRASDDERRSG